MYTAPSVLGNSNSSSSSSNRRIKKARIIIIITNENVQNKTKATHNTNIFYRTRRAYSGYTLAYNRRHARYGRARTKRRKHTLLDVERSEAIQERAKLKRKRKNDNEQEKEAKYIV